MILNEQIKYWARLVCESSDIPVSEDDGVPSDIDSNLKQLGQVSNTLKDKIQNILTTQRDKIPEKKLKELIVKLIHIDPESVSDEDYKFVGIDKKEYMNLIKDITFESSSLNITESDNNDNLASEFLRNTVKEFVSNKLDTKDWKKLDDTLFDKMTSFAKEKNLKMNEFAYNLDFAWMKIYKNGEYMKFSQEEKNMFMALGDSTRQMIIRSKKLT